MSVNPPPINYNEPSPGLFIFRIIVLIGMILIILINIVLYISFSNRAIHKNDISHDTSFYDKSYYKKEYGSLRTYLYLDRVPDDKYYGKYWEVVRANEHLKAYEDFKSAADAGMEGASEKAEEEKKALEDCLENVKFKDNREKIQELLEKI
jgi:hypothetical protein